MRVANRRSLILGHSVNLGHSAKLRFLSLAVSLPLWGACGDDAGAPDMAMTCGAITKAYRFADGSHDGHADPAGARAAHQARAGRIRDVGLIHSPSDVRFPVRVGDFLLANDKIALYIEDARRSDGYNPFGGEIAAIETVGEDGTPRGLSEWGEAFFSASGMVVAPDAVTVLNDGSDGKAAIVRSQGVLKIAPPLEGYTFILGDLYPQPAAIDYILEPGAEKVTVRMSIQNTDAVKRDLSAAQIVAFLMNRSATFTPEHGFAPLTSATAWVGWESGEHAVAARIVKPLSFNYLAAVEGAQLFLSSGAVMEACQPVTFDYVELVVASPGIDALREAMRRVDGEAPWRAVTGTVKDAGGNAVAGAFVHATLADGTYLSRATTLTDGTFTVHLPMQSALLQVTARGLPTPSPTTVDVGTSTVALAVGALGQISITATEKGSGAALPVRVQVLPATAPAALPAAFGADDAGQGRAHLVFSADGKASVAVAPGVYRVVVSHGYEYELFDQMVTIAGGDTIALLPVLERSVSTPGVLSADFHIHSFYSLDSADPVVYKVRGALAEGLELPVSSEHEFVVDFQPVVEQLGATAWAHGFASEELSTSRYGHFGVVPLESRTDLPNRGTVDWVGLKPPAFFAAVRKMPTDPALIVNHPMSATAFKGYFADVSFMNATAMGDPMEWSSDFDAVEVFNESDLEDNRTGSLAAWFSLINHGKKVWTTGSSDNHKMTVAPVGYPRTFLNLGTDDPNQVTPTMLRDAIRSGRSVVSGGLYMTVTGPSGVGPGGTIPNATGTVTFDVVVQSPSWFSAKSLEVFVDGESKQTIDLVPSVTPGPGKKYEATIDLAGDGSGKHFVVFHASSPGVDLAPVHPTKKPFAVSNPIFY